MSIQRVTFGIVHRDQQYVPRQVGAQVGATLTFVDGPIGPCIRDVDKHRV